MTLSAGSRLGPYAILGPLGAGGMGEVYRARDTRLDRIVAVKILPAHLSDKPSARERFEREAKAVSSLNHRNICQLYDVGAQDGISYLVMEYLEGETLADRLHKGPLPLDQVLAIGSEICEGIEKAHRKGVVHRDLKPGNVMVTKSGVKLMDFGLAKSFATSPAPDSSALETVAHPLTAEGSLVGTFQYMSPEQIEGKEVDGRTDIFSLGSILYEMVTGRRAFEGRSQIGIASSILEKEPEPMSASSAETPPELEHVVRICLAKDPDQRFQSAHDVGLQLRWIATGAPRRGSVATRTGRERWILLGMVALLVAALVIVLLRSRAGAGSTTTWSSILPPDGTSFSYFAGPVAISHDGHELAFVATASGQDVLFVRSLDNPTAQALPGTDGASYPFWSADDRRIGFFMGGKLKTTDAAGGPVITLCDAVAGRGGDWSERGVVLFSTTWGGVHRVSSTGGVPADVTALNLSVGELSHRWPTFLPDGRHFLYLASNFRGGSAEASSIYLASIDSSASKVLFRARSNVTWIPGYLLYVRNHLLLAQPFDQARLEIHGEPVPIADNVQYDELTWRGVFSSSGGGLIAYQGGNSGVNAQLVRADRTGREIGRIGPPGDLITHRISPDGRALAVSVLDSSVVNYQLWLFDMARGKESRLIFGQDRSRNPIWSPDGRTVLFAMNRNGPYDLFEKLSDSTGSETPVLASDRNKFPTDWSADGRFVAFGSGSEDRTSIWIWPRFGEGKPYLFVEGNKNAGEARFSPDGRWVAYTSDESGRSEIYVTSFPQAASKWQVSTAGGSSPRWRRDGKELFYLSADSKMMSAEVDGGGAIFQVAGVRALFSALLKTGPSRFELSPTSEQIGYDVAPDGSWFAINAPPPGAPPPITLVTNWSAERARH